MIKNVSKGKRLLAVLMSLAIAVAFIPSIGMAAPAKKLKNKAAMSVKASKQVHQKKDYNDETGYELEYSGYWDSGTEIDEYDVDEYPPIYPEDGDCFTVTDDEGVSTEYYFDEDAEEFYDKDNNIMPYYWGYSWDDDYSFTPGEDYYCSFSIYDEDDNFLAWSQSIPVFVTENQESAIISKVIYRVIEGTNEACAYWVTDDDISGKVTIPASVKMRNGRTYPVTLVDEYAFDGCRKISSVSLPNSIKSIGERAFCDTGLVEIKIPSSVKNIGYNAIGYNSYYNNHIEETEYYKVNGFIIDAKAGTTGAQYAVANGFKWVDRDAEKAAREKAARAKAARIKSAKAAITKVRAKALKGKKVRLTWNAVKNVSGFEIYKGAKKKGAFKKVATIKTGKAKSWSSKILKKGKKSFFKVRTFTNIDGKKVFGKWSNVANAKGKK